MANSEWGGMPPAPSDVPSDAKTWAALAHVSAFVGYLVPFGNIVGPLLIWLFKKNDYEFVDDQGKESLNFQITITIAIIIAGFSILLLIGIILLPLVLLFDLVMVIIAAIKASNGERYRYPLTIRLIQ